LTNWLIDHTDSLYFGDRVRGLRWFIGNFPEDEVSQVWSRLRYVNVDVDLRAPHTNKSVNLAYFSREENATLCLGKMKELGLVKIRVIVLKENQR
jgi:hypothetical protein